MATKRVVATDAKEDSGLAILQMVMQKEEGMEGVRKRRRGAAGARKRIVDAMPEMADALVEKAKEGSVPHLKLAFELGGVEKGGSKPAYTQRVERQLLQELDVLFPPENAADVG